MVSAVTRTKFDPFKWWLPVNHGIVNGGTKDEFEFIDCRHIAWPNCIECCYGEDIPIDSIEYCPNCQAGTWSINGLCARCQPITVGCG